MSDVGSKEILPNIGQDKGKNSDPSVRPGPLHTSGRENTILEPVRRDAGSKRRGGVPVPWQKGHLLIYRGFRGEKWHRPPRCLLDESPYKPPFGNCAIYSALGGQVHHVAVPTTSPCPWTSIDSPAVRHVFVPRFRRSRQRTVRPHRPRARRT